MVKTSSKGLDKDPPPSLNELQEMIVNITNPRHINANKSTKPFQITYSSQFMETFNNPEIINSDNEKPNKLMKHDDDSTDIDDPTQNNTDDPAPPKKQWIID